MTKTHWLHNPNKNYLGHQDLPNGDDVILTICSAQWEEVKNPIINTSDAKRVIRFIEKDNWIKPFICNETNAKEILKNVDEKFMEDCHGKKIKIGISKTKVKRQEVDCLRVRNVKAKDLDPNYISKDQIKELLNLCEAADKSEEFISKALNLSKFEFMPVSKFENVKSRLMQIILEKNEDTK